MVSDNSDGSVTISPTGTDNVLQVTGDPASRAKSVDSTGMGNDSWCRRAAFPG